MEAITIKYRENLVQVLFWVGGLVARSDSGFCLKSHINGLDCFFLIILYNLVSTKIVNTDYNIIW